MDSQQQVFLSLAIMRLIDEKKISLVKFVQELEPSVQMDGEFNLWAYQQSTLNEIRKFVEGIFKKTPNEVLSEEELKKQLQKNQETLAVIRSFMPTCFLFKAEHKNSHSTSCSNNDSDDSSSDGGSDNSSSSSSSSSEKQEDEEEEKTNFESDSGISSGTSPNNEIIEQAKESLKRLSNNLYRCFLSKVGIKVTIKKISSLPKNINGSNGCGMKRKKRYR